MTRQCHDLTISSIDTYLAGLVLSISLLLWEQSPSLIPVILMTSSSLLLLGLTQLYFRWKDRQVDY